MNPRGNGNINVGFVGAGTNTRAKHIPGFQAINNVTLYGVANRSRTSGSAVAGEYGIENVFDDWQALVQSPDVDAICIGTWPYMHGTVALAALESGKHVLTEARMAENASEARAMLAASREHPELITQVVPSPFTLKVDQTIKDLINEGYLGSITAINIRVTQDNFPDFGGPLLWRHNRDFSGYNIMTMGIWYEALLRWVGPATKVSAMTKVVVNQRVSSEGDLTSVTIPDHVDVLCEMACGAQAHLGFSTITGLGATSEAWLFGTEGTLRLDGQSLTISGGQRGDTELKEIPIDPAKQSEWRVEEEFMEAIRGVSPVTHTPFMEAVKYMEWTEAVTRSAQTGQVINLPL
jgi:predicted dehydrogenase